MKVINLFGGPGSGKSTSAAALFVYLKNRGIRTELVGEEAKDQIYWGSPIQLSNQMYLAALQYTRLKNLENSGCKIAISDSPLIMGLVYASGKVPYYNELYNLVHKLDSEFENINVFIRRTKPYDTFGRTQNALAAAAVDDLLKTEVWKYNFTVNGDEEGQHLLGEIILKETNA